MDWEGTEAGGDEKVFHTKTHRLVIQKKKSKIYDSGPKFAIS